MLQSRPLELEQPANGQAAVAAAAGPSGTGWAWLDSEGVAGESPSLRIPGERGGGGGFGVHRDRRLPVGPPPSLARAAGVGPARLRD